jgi:Glyoxalase-like domain
MRLDHVSYVTTHEQLADTVQRLGSLIGSAFVDGGIHPRFGTRNFTCALKNGQYIEVVCPLDHPATEQTPWGKAVKKKADEGGGWFTWVFSTENIAPFEERFGRVAAEGHRTRPNGTELKWKQIGVQKILNHRELPFFIEWLTQNHPSHDGNPVAEILKIVISCSDDLEKSWFKDEIIEASYPTTIELVESSQQDLPTGITEVHLSTSSTIVILD